MKKKTRALSSFLINLHNHIVTNPQFRHVTRGKSEVQIQTEIRPLIIDYLIKYFTNKGYKDPIKKANKSFYWEGQEGSYGRERKETFGSRNYPDFIITAPYLISIEYKQINSGSLIKQGIGQSIMHTLSGDFDYAYYLFNDQTRNKEIRDSLNGPNETKVQRRIWKDFNVFLKIV